MAKRKKKLQKKQPKAKRKPKAAGNVEIALGFMHMLDMRLRGIESALQEIADRYGGRLNVVSGHGGLRAKAAGELAEEILSADGSRDAD